MHMRGIPQGRHLQHLPPDFSIAEDAPPQASARENGLSEDLADPSCTVLGDGRSLPKLDLPPFSYDLQFGEVLGRGASGASVMRCVAVPPADGLGEPVPCAAKVLPLSSATFPDMVEDFGREVALMQTLKHPSLVGFIGARHIATSPCSDANEAYVLCIELFNAGDLDAIVRRRRQQGKPFGMAELGPILAQVAAGLAYLHSRGVLHRDLKASNVFLKSRPEAADGEMLDLPLWSFHAKLGDFGCCKVASRAQTPTQTPQWMAPEVVRQEGYGRQSDVWSFGALLYELLELGVPYGEEITLPQLEKELVAGRAPALSDRHGAETRVPSLVALMDACFALDPSDRPRAADLSSMLEAAGWLAQAPTCTVVGNRT